MDLSRGFVVEDRQCGCQKTSGTRVMGKNLGPEDGMDRTSVHGPISPGTEYLARISFRHDSHPDGCPRGRQEAHLLESGWGLCGVECHMQKSSTPLKTPRTLNVDTFNMSRYAMKWWKSWKRRWPKSRGIWCNLAKGIPS